MDDEKLRERERKWAQENYRSGDRIQKSLAVDVLLVSHENSLKFVESKREHYVNRLRKRLSEGNFTFNKGTIEELVAILEAYSLDASSPLSARITTEQRRKAPLTKRECFNARYGDVAEFVVREWPYGSAMASVFGDFIKKAKLNHDEDRKFAEELLKKSAKKYGKEFKTGRPSQNDDPNFERIVLERVIQRPEDGLDKLTGYIEGLPQKPYQGKLTSKQLKSKIRSILGTKDERSGRPKGLNSRELREDFASRK